MKERRRFFSLLSILVILLCVALILASSILNPNTRTRYMKSEKDEILAHYTGLYFDHNGNGKSVALENGEGTVEFDIMNYIGEDVTKRDITYNIYTVSNFYASNGTKIDNPNGTQDLYVKDVWSIPTKIGNDTYKYEVNITRNSGQKEGTNYILPYEERDESAVGKTHNVTVSLKRKDGIGEMVGVSESVSLVIQLEKPYKQVFIVDLVVSNRLIVFSNSEISRFDVDMKKINVQTFDSFAYFKNELGNYVERINEDSEKFTSRAFKVVFEWNDLVVNANDFKFFHDNQEGIISGPNGNYNTVDPNGLDLGKPYLLSLNQDLNAEGNHYGTLTMYVPQSSNFGFDCLIEGDNPYFKATVYIYSTSSATFVPYDITSWSGYNDNNTSGCVEIIK